MSKFFAFNRGAKRLVSPCGTRALNTNPHVRGFQVITDKDSDVLISWSLKNYTLFPAEVEAALVAAAQAAGIELAEAEELPLLVAIDALGGAQDYLFGGDIIHVTCANKLGTPWDEGGYHYQQLPPVRRQTLGLWLRLVRMLQKPGWKLFGYLEKFDFSIENPKAAFQGVITQKFWGLDYDVDLKHYLMDGKPVLRFQEGTYIRISMEGKEVGEEVILPRSFDMQAPYEELLRGILLNFQY